MMGLVLELVGSQIMVCQDALNFLKVPMMLILCILLFCWSCSLFFWFCMKTWLWTMDGFAQKKHQKLTFETPPNLPKVPSTKDLLTPSPKPLPSPRRRFSCKVSPLSKGGYCIYQEGWQIFKVGKIISRWQKPALWMDSWMVSPLF